LTVSAANVIAQQDASAPTRLALEVTFYPGRSPAYETVPGPDSKPSGDELRLFGIEPFEVKLVRVNPNIAPVPPVILKGVDSIVVINAMARETTLPSYRIILRNQSNKNIVALGVDVVASGNVRMTSKPRGIDGQPLIAAGKEYWLGVPAPNRAQPIIGGYVPTSPSDQQYRSRPPCSTTAHMRVMQKRPQP